MINKKMVSYVQPVVNYIKKFPEKFNKLVIYGESVDATIDNPVSLHFALGLVNQADERNYDLLGEVLEIIIDLQPDEYEFTLVPISEQLLATDVMNDIKNGEVVYELHT